MTITEKSCKSHEIIHSFCANYCSNFIEIVLSFWVYHWNASLQLQKFSFNIAYSNSFAGNIHRAQQWNKLEHSIKSIQFLSNHLQYFSSEPSEQCCCPSHHCRSITLSFWFSHRKCCVSPRSANINNSRGKKFLHPGGNCFQICRSWSGII